MEEHEKARRAAERRAKRKRQVLISRIIIIVLVLLIAVLLFLVFWGNAGRSKKPQDKTQKGAVTEGISESGTEAAPAVTETETQTEPAPDVMEEAERLAAMYDYEGAIALLQGDSGYSGNPAMAAKVTEWETAKANLVEFPLDQVTHVFYHTLVKDTSLAFDGDSKEAGYNQVMTTIDEFNKITQSMYEKGYVLVSLHDMCTVNDDGTVSRGKIMLPPDKKAFVLSQDDVSYYHYMDGDGMATKLIIDENGKVKTEYKEQDGSVSVGDFDMIPLIDTFVEEHPDFSYHGAKGIIALTGYNGVLGYRTEIAYKTRENLDEYQ